MASYGTIEVKYAKTDVEILKLTFVDRAEFDNAIVILDGVKEIKINPFWGYEIMTARTAMDAVKHWM